MMDWFCAATSNPTSIAGSGSGDVPGDEEDAAGELEGELTGDDENCS